MNNIHKQSFKITRSDREILLKQKPFLIWFTGLSGSGKSTLANHLEISLNKQGYKTYLLDGDNLRSGLNSDLGFSDEDRKENLRRVGEVAKILLDAGIIVIAAFISPKNAERELIRKSLPIGRFVEVFVKCPIETCEKRDTKGLYLKARQGMIKNFTGIDSPYEIPQDSEIILDTKLLEVNQCLNQILSFLEPNFLR